MGQVSAASSILIDAEPAAVLDAIADYQNVRPKILSPQYSEYQVLQGGRGGQGTVAKWKLQATKSRVRRCRPWSMSPATPSSRRTRIPRW